MIGSSKLRFSGMKRARSPAPVAASGRFEVADGGTIFLDEVGDQSGIATQTAARPSKRGGLRRWAATERRIHVDVRVVSATNRPISIRSTARQPFPRRSLLSARVFDSAAVAPRGGLLFLCSPSAFSRGTARRTGCRSTARRSHRKRGGLMQGVPHWQQHPQLAALPWREQRCRRPERASAPRTSNSSTRASRLQTTTAMARLTARSQAPPPHRPDTRGVTPGTRKKRHGCSRSAEARFTARSWNSPWNPR